MGLPIKHNLAIKPNYPSPEDGQFHYVVIDDKTGQVVQNGIYYLGNVVLLRGHPSGAYTLKCRAVDYKPLEYKLRLSSNIATQVLPVWTKGPCAL